jgi:hypothetical protein
MRTLLRVIIPVETGNKAIKDGTLPKTMESFSKKYKPEAAYFYPEGGRRSALFVFDLPDPTHIPAIAESFFFGLDAEIYMTPVMNADDLRAGLEKTKKGK